MKKINIMYLLTMLAIGMFLAGCEQQAGGEEETPPGAEELLPDHITDGEKATLIDEDPSLSSEVGEPPEDAPGVSKTGMGAILDTLVLTQQALPLDRMYQFMYAPITGLRHMEIYTKIDHL